MDKKSEFKKLYTSYSEELFRFCMFRTNSTEQSEDIVVDAFIKLYEQDLESIDNARAWLFKVTRNIMYDSFRKQKSNDAVQDYDEDLVDYSDISFEKQVISEETAEIIKERLNELDQETADIIIMRIWDDLKFTEIGEILNMSSDAVRKRFNRGIEFIKNAFSREEKQLKGRSITIPIILAGLLGISLKPIYAISTASTTNILGVIGTTLNISLTGMTGTGIATAGVATTAKAGLLATTAGKVAAGVMAAALVVSGAGLGLVYINNQDNSSNTTNEQSETLTNENEEKLVTYTNENFPNFSFEYDENVWSLEETQSLETQMIRNENFPTTNLSLSSEAGKLDITLKFSSEGFFRCDTGEYKEINDMIHRIKVTGQNVYNYHGDVRVKGTDGWQSVVDAWVGIPEYKESDFCYMAEGQIYTPSTYISKSGVWIKEGENFVYTVLVSFSPSANETYNLDAADKIVESMNVNDPDELFSELSIEGTNCGADLTTEIDCRLMNRYTDEVVANINRCSDDFIVDNSSLDTKDICLPLYGLVFLLPKEDTASQKFYTHGGDGGLSIIRVYEVDFITGDIAFLDGSDAFSIYFGLEAFYDCPENPNGCYFRPTRKSSDICNDPTTEEYYTPECFEDWDLISKEDEPRVRKALQDDKEDNIHYYSIIKKYNIDFS